MVSGSGGTKQTLRPEDIGRVAQSGGQLLKSAVSIYRALVPAWLCLVIRVQPQIVAARVCALAPAVGQGEPLFSFGILVFSQRTVSVDVRFAGFHSEKLWRHLG